MCFDEIKLYISYFTCIYIEMVKNFVVSVEVDVYFISYFLSMLHLFFFSPTLPKLQFVICLWTEIFYDYDYALLFQSG